MTLVLGQETEGPNAGLGISEEITWCFKAHVTVDAEAEQIGVKFSSTPTAKKVKVAIKADESGKPKDGILGSEAELETLIKGSNLSTSIGKVALEKGKDYWICLVSVEGGVKIKAGNESNTTIKSTKKGTTTLANVKASELSGAENKGPCAVWANGTTEVEFKFLSGKSEIKFGTDASLVGEIKTFAGKVPTVFKTSAKLREEGGIPPVLLAGNATPGPGSQNCVNEKIYATQFQPILTGLVEEVKIHTSATPGAASQLRVGFYADDGANKPVTGTAPIKANTIDFPEATPPANTWLGVRGWEFSIKGSDKYWFAVDSIGAAANTGLTVREEEKTIYKSEPPGTSWAFLESVGSWKSLNTKGPFDFQVIGSAEEVTRALAGKSEVLFGTAQAADATAGLIAPLQVAFPTADKIAATAGLIGSSEIKTKVSDAPLAATAAIHPKSDTVFTTKDTLAAEAKISGSIPTKFATSGKGDLTGGLKGTSSLNFATAATTVRHVALAGDSNLKFGTVGTINITHPIACVSSIKFDTTDQLGATAGLIGKISTKFSDSAPLAAHARLSSVVQTKFIVSGELKESEAIFGEIAGLVAVKFATSGTITATAELKGSSSLNFSTSAQIHEEIRAVLAGIAAMKFGDSALIHHEIRAISPSNGQIIIVFEKDQVIMDAIAVTLQPGKNFLENKLTPQKLPTSSLLLKRGTTDDPEFH